MRGLVVLGALNVSKRVEGSDEDAAGEPRAREKLRQFVRSLADVQGNYLGALSKPIIGLEIRLDLVIRNFRMRQTKTLRKRRVDASRLFAH